MLSTTPYHSFDLLLGSAFCQFQLLFASNLFCSQLKNVYIFMVNLESTDSFTVRVEEEKTQIKFSGR